MSEFKPIRNCIKGHEMDIPTGYDGSVVVELPFDCPTIKDSVAVRFRKENGEVTDVWCRNAQRGEACNETQETRCEVSTDEGLESYMGKWHHTPAYDTVDMLAEGQRRSNPTVRRDNRPPGLNYKK